MHLPHSVGSLLGTPNANKYSLIKSPVINPISVKVFMVRLVLKLLKRGVDSSV